METRLFVAYALIFVLAFGALALGLAWRRKRRRHRREMRGWRPRRGPNS